MKSDDMIIRRETPSDYDAVEHLTREAFWNVYRPGCTEHYVVHVLRKDPAFVPELDLVMEWNGQLIGHVMYMRAKITADDGRELPVMTFGPISIHPDAAKRAPPTKTARTESPPKSSLRLKPRYSESSS